jgi:hypothetical protein
MTTKTVPEVPAGMQRISEWMPWNYRETLARTGALLDDAA